MRSATAPPYTRSSPAPNGSPATASAPDPATANCWAAAAKTTPPAAPAASGRVHRRRPRNAVLPEHPGGAAGLDVRAVHGFPLRDVGDRASDQDGGELRGAARTRPGPAVHAGAAGLDRRGVPALRRHV